MGRRHFVGDFCVCEASEEVGGGWDEVGGGGVFFEEEGGGEEVGGLDEAVGGGGGEEGLVGGAFGFDFCEGGFWEGGEGVVGGDEVFLGVVIREEVLVGIEGFSIFFGERGGGLFVVAGEGFIGF